MLRRTALATGLATALGTAVASLAVGPLAAPAAGAAAGGAKVVDRCITSVPDPGTTDPVEICYSLFKPAGASRKHRVPLLMHSHGWGGSRATDPSTVQEFLDAGYGVLSFDQRGFGESGGQAYVENPKVEGHDVRKLVRLVSRLRWVQQDGRGDPHLGAVGGSYGGGYQFLAAFEELRTKGKPVFDALAPEITWNDLSTSLAPEGVVRTEWASALSAGAVPSDALPHNIYKALVEGVATGTWPDGSVPGTENLEEFFKRNGPTWHVDHGRRLDIPVLFGQGTTDSLFNLQQGLDNWRSAITRKARKRSIFVGYNGGHVLPAVFPQGVDVTSDPCSKKLAGGDFRQLSIRFFDETLKHRHTGLRGWGRLHIATPDSTCTTVRSAAPHDSRGSRVGGEPGVRGRADPVRDRRGPDPGRRVVVPHREADRHAGQPGVLRARGRHVPRGRASGAEQHAADQRDRARRRQPSRCASSCPPPRSTCPRGSPSTCWSPR